MKSEHVPFDRYFAPVDEVELRDPEYLSYMRTLSRSVQVWDDLLDKRCVVILAEGDSGKTHEFEHKCKELKAEGKSSFFLQLEKFQDHDFDEVLSPSECGELSNWMSGKESEAYFFLDAVDELKLRHGALRKAVSKVVGALGAHRNRIHFFISCRPNDWNSELDLAATSALLSVPEKRIESLVQENSESVFSEIVRNYSSRANNSTVQEMKDEVAEVFSLLPFTRDDVVRFAKSYSQPEADQLVQQLDLYDLWGFYRVPLDVITAIDQIKHTGELGDFKNQLETRVGLKLSPSSRSGSMLSLDKAREGAERVSLALILMNRVSIHIENPGSDAEGLGIADVLTDWSKSEHLELVTRPLFQSTGVGVVRIQRSIQEYLAANRLIKLREIGLSSRDLFGLIFRAVHAAAIQGQSR